MQASLRVRQRTCSRSAGSRSLRSAQSRSELHDRSTNDPPDRPVAAAPECARSRRCRRFRHGLQLWKLAGLDMYETASKPDLVTALGAMPIDYKAATFKMRVMQIVVRALTPSLPRSAAGTGGDPTRCCVGYGTPCVIEQGKPNQLAGVASVAMLGLLSVLPDGKSARWVLHHRKEATSRLAYRGSWVDAKRSLRKKSGRRSPRDSRCARPNTQTT